MILNYTIPFLDAIFNKALFIQIKRDPVTNVSSVLDARRRQLGSEAAWYSFKIPEYDELKDLDPVTQSAGQVYYIDKAVTRGMASVDESRKLVVQYEDFCEDPGQMFWQLAEKLKLIERNYKGPEQFKLPRYADLPNREPIVTALLRFKDQ